MLKVEAQQTENWAISRTLSARFCENISASAWAERRVREKSRGKNSCLSCVLIFRLTQYNELKTRTYFFHLHFDTSFGPTGRTQCPWKNQKLEPTFLPQKSSKKLGEGFKHGHSTPENRPFR